MSRKRGYWLGLVLGFVINTVLNGLVWGPMLTKQFHIPVSNGWHFVLMLVIDLLYYSLIISIVTDIYALAGTKKGSKR